MISVVIPLYNKEKQIAETLRSVLQQSFQEFEIVVVNDGSTDGSVVAVESVQDGRIRIIHQENAGVSAARNRGIEEARYELIAFLDADDRWKPDYLQVQYELTQKHPECSVFACNYEFVHTDGSVHPTIIRNLPFEETDGILSNYFDVASCSHPPMWTSAVMSRKCALVAVGGFPVGTQWGEDLLTWAKLAFSYSVAYSKLVMASYIFEATDSVGRLPRDIKEVPDYVATQLMSLRERADDRKLRQEIGLYVAFWFKMRAHINIVWGNVRAARKNACFAIRYQWNNVKAWIIYFLSFMPKVTLIKLLRNKR